MLWIWILLGLALFALIGAHPAAAADAWINDAALYAWALAKMLFWIGSWVCLLIITLSLGAYVVARLLNKHKMRRDPSDLIDLVVSICIRIWSALFVLLGVSILGIQLFLWAKTGSWNSVSVATALWLIGFDLSSIYFPTDWKSLATIASWLLAFPLSLSALLIGAYIYFEASVIRPSYRERIKAEQYPQPGDPDYLDWANRRGRYAQDGKLIADGPSRRAVVRDTGHIQLNRLTCAEVEREALAGFDEEGRQWGAEDCKKVLRDWFPVLLERARKRKGPDTHLSDYQSEIDDVWSILNGLREAFSRNVDRTCYNSVQYKIWAWPSDKELFWPPLDEWRHEQSPADVKQLASDLAEYVERPWLQHNIIDGAAINACLFSSLSHAMHLYRMGAFGRTDWGYMLRGMGWKLHPVLNQLVSVALGFIFFPFLKWIMLPAVAATLMFEQYSVAAEIVFGLWVAYVALRLATFRGRRHKKKDADRTTSAMRAAWEHSCGEVINPTRLRELVLDAEQKGAIDYPPVLHTLLDSAIQRDPTALRTRRA